MRFAAILVVLAGCRSLFGIGSPELDDGARGDDTSGFKDAHVIDGPPDSANGGCVAHADCMSDACLPDGSCAADTDVAWVTTMGGSGMACTKLAPCATIGTAIATGKKYVRIVNAGGFVDEPGLVLQANVKVTILADPGAQVSRTTSGAIMSMSSADVTIYDLWFNGAQGITGITMNGSARLELQRCRLRALSNNALSVNGTLIVNRSLFELNPDGAIEMNGGSFAITNSIFAHNGSQQTTYGALHVNGVTQAQFELNTVADNLSKTGGQNGTVSCMVAVKISNSLLAGNSPNPSSNCDVSTSLIVLDETTVHFANLNTGDYHLTVQTPNTIVDQTFASTIVEDYDGQHRLQGAGYDYGADEYKP